MVIGVPKEIKNNENRVAITPSGVFELSRKGHTVFLEQSAGVGSGISDSDFQSAGAIILDDVKELYAKSDIIVKVKEPLESEFHLYKERQILFTYLHLAPNPSLTRFLLDRKIIAVAYETIQNSDGSLPLLAPMSEVAGRMSVQVGANLLQKFNGGSGILLGGVPGVKNAKVLIIGGGVAGTNAAKIALGLGANVTVMDVNKNRLTHLDDIFSGKITTIMSNPYSIAQEVKDADLLIGAVLIPGASAPKIVSEEMVKSMKKGSVIVDIAIDQGGSVETIDRVTTHDNPCYEKYGIIHYSVPNIPGAVPRTSTYALTGVTLSYLLKIAESGPKNAFVKDPVLRSGLNCYNGFVTCQSVAESQGLECVDFMKLIS